MEAVHLIMGTVYLILTNYGDSLLNSRQGNPGEN